MAESAVIDPGKAPKATAVAPPRFVPLMVTDVPPLVDPLDGATPETVGGSAYVNSSAGEVAELPTDVVTVTSTVPIPSAGLVTVMELAELAVMVPGVNPKSTAVALLR